MAEETRREPTERTLRWRRLFFGVPRAGDGMRCLAELGRELGAYTYLDPEDPHSLVKQNVWKRILGMLGIVNASSIEQCIAYIEALSHIPPVEEEVISQEEE